MLIAKKYNVHVCMISISYYWCIYLSTLAVHIHLRSHAFLWGCGSTGGGGGGGGVVRSDNPSSRICGVQICEGPLYILYIAQW